MVDLWNEGEIVEMNGYASKMIKLAGFRFDGSGKNRCAVCGANGGASGSWFLCDSCVSIAFIETGEVFIPLLKRDFPQLYEKHRQIYGLCPKHHPRRGHDINIPVPGRDESC